MSAVMLLFALVFFVLAAFGVQIGKVEMMPIGLAFMSAAFLVGCCPAAWFKRD